MVIYPDEAERPTYSLAEAARYARTSPQSIARWRAGYAYPTQQGTRRSGPLTGGAASGFLSFNELVEVAVVSAARCAKVPMKKVRIAIDTARSLYGVERPLMTIRFKTDGREIFTHELEANGASRFVNLSRTGQTAWKYIQEVLNDLEYESGVAVRWWPEGTGIPIVIDPRVAFGRPYVVRRGVSTDAIRSQFQAGESIEAIIDDFELSRDEVEAALRFELPKAA